MANHNKLLALYNELDSLLRTRYKECDYSKSCIMRFIKDLSNSGYPLYVQASKRLNMIRILRNDLIHEFDMNQTSLIEVTDETINFLEDMIKEIKYPQKAIDFATKTKDLLVVNVDNPKYNFIELVNIMRERGFTHVPVVNNSGILLGVFSPYVLFDYLSKNKGESINTANIEEIAKLCRLENHSSEKYEFIASYRNKSDVSQLFVQNYEKNRRIAAVFVTKTGSPDEPLLGLIVLKDLFKDN